MAQLHIYPRIYPQTGKEGVSKERSCNGSVTYLPTDGETRRYKETPLTRHFKTTPFRLVSIPKLHLHCSDGFRNVIIQQNVFSIKVGMFLCVFEALKFRYVLI
jgi:hypothetical protein